jgi:curved DNA-binding protein CbpA
MAAEQLFIVTIIYNITKKIITERAKVTNKKKWIQIICFLYAFFLLWSYFDARPFNVYELLDVSRCIDSEKLKEYYKQTVKIKHPDKNHSPNAHEEFILIKKHFDLIRTPEVREKYEKYGTETEKQLLFTSFEFYGLWIIACNLCYFSKTPNMGGKILFMLILYGILEWAIIQIPFYPNICLWPLPIFDQLSILKALFPAIGLGIACFENLKHHESEATLKTRIEEFNSNGGTELFQRIKTKQSPEALGTFIEKNIQAAKKKYSNSTFSNLFYAVIVLYLVRSKFQ